MYRLVLTTEMSPMYRLVLTTEMSPMYRLVLTTEMSPMYRLVLTTERCHRCIFMLMIITMSSVSVYQDHLMLVTIYLCPHIS